MGTMYIYISGNLGFGALEKDLGILRAENEEHLAHAAQIRVRHFFCIKFGPMARVF